MARVAAISHSGAAEVVAYEDTRAVTAGQFIADVRRVADALPERSSLVNFCADRYRFAVGLVAALLRNQVSLLPPNQTPEMLRGLRQEYPDLYALTDADGEAPAIECVAYPDAVTAADHGVRSLDMPAFEENQVAAIAFTSGSTGTPTAHRKTWGALARGATAEANRFGLEGSGATLVGTVPAQHMYGLESTVLMALHGGMALHSGRPFYPADVAAALADVPGERVLVTTPVHLRALLNDEVPLPPLRLIICATAPLSPDLAAQAEARYAAPLHEVYGFTEAGMVATRRTVQGTTWHCLRDVKLRRDGNAVRVRGGHVEREVPFSDIIDVAGDDAFTLQGRDADLVNIAGKRTSLGHLNYQLNNVEGVNDGVFFMPEENGHAVTRLTAFVAAPGLDRDSLLDALRARVDAVFLPRPLYFVDALPRNATGKLPRQALVELAQRCAARARAGSDGEAS